MKLPKIKDFNLNINLHNYFLFIKIDGIQCITDENLNTFTRNGKPLFNIPKKILKPNTIYEVYYKNCNETMSIVRSFSSDIVLTGEHLYELYPNPDSRLILSALLSIEDTFAWVLKQGYEGLIIKSKDKWYKLKPTKTYDVEVLSIIKGKGRNSNRIGALVTKHGNVGTGLTDKDRKTIKIGDIIEVKCLEMTSNNKFRLPRFIRVRYDK